MSDANNSPPPPSDSPVDKVQLIQRHLSLILHAKQCRRQEVKLQEAGEDDYQCYDNNPDCQEMRDVLSHVKLCKLDDNCQVANCYLTKKHLEHWKKCTALDCPACAPLRQRTNLAGGQDGTASDSLDDLKDWRQQVSSRSRLLYAYKLFHDGFPFPCDALFDPRMSKLVEYCRKTENDLFKQASSKTEYAQLIWEKTEKLKQGFKQMNESNVASFVQQARLVQPRIFDA